MEYSLNSKLQKNEVIILKYKFIFSTKKSTDN